MKVVNWKTTIGAVLVVIAQLLTQAGVELSPEVQTALTTVGIFIIGLFSKDSNVTGGTTKNRGTK